MRSILWRTGVAVVALIGGFVGGYVILPWGLVTPHLVVWPLALGFGALLAALGTGWTSTLLAPDREECASFSWTIFERMPVVKKVCCFKSERLLAFF